MPVEILWKPHRTVVLKGIHTLDVFDDRRFSLLSDDGQILVYGQDLKLRQFDQEKKQLMIEGDIYGIYDPDCERDTEPKEIRFWERWFG